MRKLEKNLDSALVINKKKDALFLRANLACLFTGPMS